MNKTKKITCLALLCALAYIAVFIGKLIPISIISFLQYDPKDVIVVIGGFIYGPLYAFFISVVVSLLEMFTISDTQIVGCIMNIVSTSAFACVAAAVYRNNKCIKYAVLGLLAGSVSMTATMLVWNYILTPLYMSVPRSEVVKMLLPIFLPFNLIKSLLNSSLTVIVYKPFVRILRKSGIINPGGEKGTVKVSLFIAAVFVIIMCIATVFILK